MFSYVLKRSVSAVVVVVLVATLTFLLIQAAPGGLSILMDPNMSSAEAARLKHNLGLDRPIHIQYLNWLSNAVQGDLGASLSYGGRSVTSMIMERVPATVKLGVASLLLTLVIGIPAGVVAGRRPNGLVDQVIGFLSFVALAVPSFWLGIILMIVFGAELRWLPTSGMGPKGDLVLGLKHLIMPALVLASSSAAAVIRYTRSSWLEVARLDYVRTGRSKGLTEGQLGRRHILRNALIPVVTIIGVQLPRLVGGAAVIETLFSWPGLGQLGVDAALRRDTPLILGVTLLVSAAVVASNLLVDILYPVIDPRIRYS
ncbi:MAG: ABC transporter permease [Trueperaceae bacterium]|nr:ABC transporter permease [Trueperaceae bacterium]MCC6310484.1 ABC transporter permease [Trueperaceae bacterium]MCO5173405.1 ABC transporter permease [Trueperaceae bacterium]MCW5819240.1 ABC transporter permease [Trueperaceae bacterium]